MADHNAQAHSTNGSHGGSLKSYIIGFLLSIVLTIIPVVIIMNGLMSKTAATITIITIAALQFIVQLVFFMHIRDEEGPKFNMLTLIFGILIMLLIVVGSIWVMMNNVVATA